MSGAGTQESRADRVQGNLRILTDDGPHDLQFGGPVPEAGPFSVAVAANVSRDTGSAGYAAVFSDGRARVGDVTAPKALRSESYTELDQRFDGLRARRAGPVREAIGRSGG